VHSFNLSCIIRQLNLVAILTSQHKMSQSGYGIEQHFAMTPVALDINLYNGALTWCCSGAVEYCQFETFNASCPTGHVIMMEHAQYGRPHTGRCIARDYGYVGCSMSVVHLLDRICSGRRSCQLEVPSLRDIVQPCPRDLITFLDVSYHCVIGR